MAKKIITAILALLGIFMAAKQGYAMITGSDEMLAMFLPWGFGKTGLMIFGVYNLIGALLIFFPKTFWIGNFMIAAGIVMIMVLLAFDGQWQALGIELPFLILYEVLIYLKHPLLQDSTTDDLV